MDSSNGPQDDASCHDECAPNNLSSVAACWPKMPPVGLSAPLLKPDGSSTDASLTELTLGMRLTLQNVEYTVRSVKTGGQPLQLLKGITAYFEPGQMAALIGPSGSGKTTLVDVLAGRKTQGTTEGVILYNNQKPTAGFLKRYVGYVEQFDVLIEYLTVQETLLYTAELKCAIEKSYAEKYAQVQMLLDKLLLRKCKDSRIGAQGGVKKRVNIGIALVSNPRVLFLDEPTTGLDSYTANETMTVVKNMARDGTTICSTIHSPTPYTFALFDRVLFLLGGETVYFGETKHAILFLNQFAEGIINSYENEADWLTMIIVKADRERRGPEIAAAFAQSSLKQALDSHVQECMTGIYSVDTSLLLDQQSQSSLPFWGPNRDSREKTLPFWFVFKTLIKYRTMKRFVDPTFWISRMADKITFLVLLVVTFHGVGDDFTFPEVQNVVSVLFMLTTFPLFGAGVYAPSLVVERSLTYREMSDGMYTAGIFLMMKLVDELVAGFISTTVITSIAWKLLALQGNPFYFFLVYFGNLANGIGMAYVCAAVGENINMANALLATTTAILLFFAGMLIRPPEMPSYWKWMYSLDYVKYGFGVLMYNTFTSGDEAEAATLGIEGFSINVLEYYELDGVNMKWWTGVIYFFVLGHLVVAYLCTRFIRHQKR